MKEVFLSSRKRNTQRDGHGQINNGDVRALWKLLQKRMERSQGDSWEYTTTWNWSGSQHNYSQVRMWPSQQFFEAGTQIINWNEPPAYTALCLSGFKALLTDLNAGHPVSPWQKKLWSLAWKAQLVPLTEVGSAISMGPDSWGWGGLPQTCLHERTKWSRNSSKTYRDISSVGGTISGPKQLSQMLQSSTRESDACWAGSNPGPGHFISILLGQRAVLSATIAESLKIKSLFL